MLNGLSRAFLDVCREQSCGCHGKTRTHCGGIIVPFHGKIGQHCRAPRGHGTVFFCPGHKNCVFHKCFARCKTGQHLGNILPPQFVPARFAGALVLILLTVGPCSLVRSRIYLPFCFLIGPCQLVSIVLATNRKRGRVELLTCWHFLLCSLRSRNQDFGRRDVSTARKKVGSGLLFFQPEAN